MFKDMRLTATLVVLSRVSLMSLFCLGVSFSLCIQSVQAKAFESSDSYVLAENKNEAKVKHLDPMKEARITIDTEDAEGNPQQITIKGVDKLKSMKQKEDKK